MFHIINFFLNAHMAESANSPGGPIMLKPENRSGASMIPHYFIWILLLAHMAFTLPVKAAEPAFAARATRIIDGDSIRVTTLNYKEMEVGLHGVDCPELAQPFGMKARQFTSRHLLDREVVLEQVTVDRRGVPLVRVYIGDTPFNHTIVAAGYAWRYTAYLSSPAIGVLEKKARQERRGLWLQPDPVPPWEWRRRMNPPQAGSAVK